MLSRARVNIQSGYQNFRTSTFTLVILIFIIPLIASVLKTGQSAGTNIFGTLRALDHYDMKDSPYKNYFMIFSIGSAIGLNLLARAPGMFYKFNEWLNPRSRFYQKRMLAKANEGIILVDKHEMHLNHGLRKAIYYSLFSTALLSIVYVAINGNFTANILAVETLKDFYKRNEQYIYDHRVYIGIYSVLTAASIAATNATFNQVAADKSNRALAKKLTSGPIKKTPRVIITGIIIGITCLLTPIQSFYQTEKGLLFLNVPSNLAIFLSFISAFTGLVSAIPPNYKALYDFFSPDKSTHKWKTRPKYLPLFQTLAFAVGICDFLQTWAGSSISFEETTIRIYTNLLAMSAIAINMTLIANSTGVPNTTPTPKTRYPIIDAASVSIGGVYAGVNTIFSVWGGFKMSVNYYHEWIGDKQERKDENLIIHGSSQTSSGFFSYMSARTTTPGRLIRHGSTAVPRKGPGHSA